jgi:hypothetical protein
MLFMINAKSHLARGRMDMIVQFADRRSRGRGLISLILLCELVRLGFSVWEKIWEF